MEKLRIFYLNIVLALVAFSSCEEQRPLYKKAFTEKEAKDLAVNLTQGIQVYYQGTPPAQFLLKEALILDSTLALAHREVGAPLLKRGIVNKSIKAYSKAVRYDSLIWQGWRGYMYLYFYRDYDNAIRDFNATDSLTLNFVDYPQSESVDFMRALCYLKKKDHQNSLRYFEKYFQHESKIDDLYYVESRAFLYHGIVYYEMGDFEMALKKFNFGLKYHNNADLLFWKAKVMQELNFEKGEILRVIAKAKKLFNEGFRNSRPYVEEFYQTYIEDFDGFSASL